MLRALGADAGRGAHARASSTSSTALVIPGGETTTIAKAIERDGLEPAIRAHAESGRPILGTCAGMIVCDRDHLGLVDATRPPQRLRAPDRELRGRPRDRGHRPRADARRLHPRAVDRGPRRRGRGAGERRRPPGRVREGRVLACAFHPELTDDSRLHALLMAMATAARESSASDRSQATSEERDEGPAGRRTWRGSWSATRPRCSEGETCVIEGPTAGRAADRGRLRGGARGRRPPGRRRCRSRGRPRLLRARLGRAARLGLAAGGVGGRGGRLPDRDRRRHQHARALRRSPRSARPRRQAATRQLMETTMRRAAEGDAPLGLHALPDQRLRLRRRDEPGRVRGLLLPGLPGRRRRPARRLEARVGGVRAPRGVDPGPRGGPHHRARAPTSRSGSRAARSSPPTASTTCPTASSSPARSRTRSRARSRFHLPAMVGGREVAGVRLRFEAGKVVDASAERGEEFLIELLDTDEGAAPPRRARASAPTTGSTAAPATSCSTRRSAAPSTWRSARATRRPAATTSAPSTGTWSATCARAAGSRSTASCSRRTASSSSEIATSQRSTVSATFRPRRCFGRCDTIDGFVPGAWCRIEAMGCRCHEAAGPAARPPASSRPDGGRSGGPAAARPADLDARCASRS